MKKILSGVGVALLGSGVLLALVGILALPVMATDITVNATPSYISFSSSPTTWELNGITGDGLINTDTVYYSNPLGDTTPPSATVLDAECQFTWVNGSTVDIDVFVNCGAFTGGSADMTNSGTGANGAAAYGAYSWYSGMTYSGKVVVQSSGSDPLYTTVTPGEDKKWGAQIETRTNAWAGSSSSTATMTVTALET